MIKIVIKFFQILFFNETKRINRKMRTNLIVIRINGIEEKLVDYICLVPLIKGTKIEGLPASLKKGCMSSSAAVAL